MSDDLTGQYLASRGSAYQSRADMLRQQMASTQSAEVKRETGQDGGGFDFSGIGSVASDIGMGVVEAPRQIVGGVLDATKELAQALESVIPLDEMILGRPPTDEDYLTTDEARTTTGGLIRGVSQFLTGFLPAAKAVKAVGVGGKIAQAAGAGAVADAFVFDPHEDRLSNLIEENEALSNPVTEYLAASPDDSDAEGRFKNAVEGLGLGAAADGFFKAVKLVRANRVAKQEARALAAAKGEAEKFAKADAPSAEPASPKIEVIPITINEEESYKDFIARHSDNFVDADGNVSTEKLSELDDFFEERATGAQFETKDIEDDWVSSIEAPLSDSAKKRLTEKFNRTKFYHGSPITDLTSLKPGDSEGLFISTDKEVAEYYAKGGRVYETTVRPENPLFVVESDVTAGSDEVVREAKDAGYDAIIPIRGGDAVVFKELPAQAEPPKQPLIRDESVEGEFIPFEEKVKSEAPEFKVGNTKAGDDRAKNIRVENLDTSEDVEKLIDEVAEVDAPKINESRREVITQQETEKLADDLGMSVDDLMSRRKGEAFNAEQAVAARKILVASGEKLMELSKRAATGTDEEVMLFKRALAQHQAIQAQVSGLTAEAGRALQSFRIQAGSSAAQERAIKESLAATGGLENAKDVAARFSQLDNITQVNTTARLEAKASGKDMAYEAWINGLLSAPATHVVNVLSNSLVTAWTVGERKVASAIGGSLDVRSIPEGESTAMLKGMIEGAKDGARLAWQALKTGEPSDAMTKIEVDAHKAITGDNLGLSGTAGQFADYVGEAIRLPGRFLTAGDEFFKSTGYRMELHAQAFRTAFNEGLTGDAMAKRVVDIINNPPENLHLASVDSSRYMTFTNELGKAGKSIESVRSNVPGARVIMPFIRTPVNIMSYIAERTPIAPAMSSVRQEIMAGGARRDLALAKISTGSMMMAAAADYALSGDITGAGPKDRGMVNVLKAQGWQPYSIKIGDTYYSYSRLDPLGAFIGLAADVAEISGQVDEADALDITMAAAVSVSQNMASKTYLSGLMEFFDAFGSASSDPEANNARAIRWVQRLGGSVVPSVVAAVEREVSPELSATYGIIDRIKSRVPGYSEDLPPRRNIFGEVVVLSGGLGPDIMSPIYTSTEKADPVADEIVKQGTSIKMPLRNIQGVELDAEQYDKYIRLYSGENNQFVSMPLKQKLSEDFKSSGYQNATDGPDGGKSLVIKAVFTAYRDAAKAAMLEEYPELQDDIMMSKFESARKLTGQ